MRPVLIVAATLLVLAAAGYSWTRARDPLPTPVPAVPLDEAPNLVVVILDAARADHFGSYGYERPTTPRMDEIAAESWVFRRAYSECANTSCSIANLVTGLSFLEIGTPEVAWAIPSEVTTLAEMLHETGYFTVSLSANANNSRARQTDQGFDEFRELWGDKGNNLDPHLLTRLASEAIERTPPDRPFYLQAHYLPPHFPYAPTEEFDLFSDPDYRGFVDMETHATWYDLELRKNPEAFDAADLRQLIALYDGNLRMVDDAVGRLADFLRERGLWDETVFLITADHGEAFYEHGRLGHNAHLYDEMVHVPFVLWLPPALQTAPVDVGRIVQLADILPTFAALAGARRPEGTLGVDLLNAPADPERLIFHRIRHANRAFMYGVQSLEWKLLAHPRRPDEPELYDLVADPDETTNLASSRAKVRKRLDAALRQHTRLMAERPIHIREVELPNQDIEQLRALGYID